MVRTSEENEQFVREHWDVVLLHDTTTRDLGIGILLGRTHTLWPGTDDDVSAVWATAAAFTERRLEQIRKVMNAIEWNSEPFRCVESEFIDKMLREKLELLKKGTRA